MHAVHGTPHAPRCPGLLGLLVLFMALGACRGEERGGGPVTGAPVRGGTAVVGKRTAFGGFNPVTNTDIYTDELMKYALFTPLIQYDEDLEVRPYLAQSWELLGDTAVLFHLRRDVHWHDGPLVTAEDVAFTFDLAKNPETASLLNSAYLSRVESAEVIDSFAIRFDFSRPHAQALEDFWWAPLPRHLLEDVPPAQLRTAPYNRAPVGSGPYRFVERRANERLVIARDSMFPEALGGPPYLDRVIFRIIPEAPTMLTELITGGVDVDLPVFPDQAAQIESSPDLRLFAFPGRTFYYIGWNTRRAPFDDARVRRAMTFAIDRGAIIAALLEGYGTPAVGPIPPWSPLFPEQVQPLPHDTARAARLLSDAGWIDRNGDGIRENAAGRALRFTLLTSQESPLNRAIAEVVQSDLRAVGAGVEIQPLEFQTLLTRHRGRDFDAVLTNWVLDNFQVASAPSALFHSRWADVPGSANRSSFANPRADALIERGAAATDPDSARAIWAEFTELLREEQPFTFLFWLNELAASRQRIQGVVMDPRGELVSIADWWLPGGERR
ncbi:MAG TPA: ABC transporter substrate-binding protein [Longimicrobiales bacterium]